MLTPLDLVANGATTDAGVQNRIRFLMMLDADGDPANGIAISDNVRARAAQWSQVDFATADLPAALATIIADAQSADAGILRHFEGVVQILQPDGRYATAEKSQNQG